MAEPHTHGGTDAPECTTCRSQRQPSKEALDLAGTALLVFQQNRVDSAALNGVARKIDEHLAKAKADAWNEGATAATNDYGIGEVFNPYRCRG